MSDKELLELAAKAAGIERIRWNDNHLGGWLDGCGAPSTWWNPLTDDGDALRLAVKLQMPVFSFDAGSRVVWDQDSKGEHVRETNTSDPYAATRRAIVRAAAEIGKDIS